MFYVLTKKYYPVPEVSGGFQFDLGGATSTLVPGPSGIFLRVKYDPATFAKTLNWIVAYGPGNQGGAARNTDCPTRRSMSLSPQAPIAMISAGDSNSERLNPSRF